MKVFISNYPFGRYDKSALETLQKNGFEVSLNPYGRKLLPEETRELARHCDVIIAGTEKLDLLVKSSQQLKLIARLGIGLDAIPLKLCREKGIPVCYTPDAVTQSVVELTIGLLFSALRLIVRAHLDIQEGLWIRHYGKSISECTVGIIGMGRVGRSLALHLLPFKPGKILVNDIVDKSKEIQELKAMGLNIEFVTKEFIYKNSDIITLHVPATKLTRNLIDAPQLALFSKDSILINCARGDIVNEDALYDALHKKMISGAALDVFQVEPYSGILKELPNIILTQHMGACTFSSRIQMENECVADIIRFFKGEPLKSPVPDFEYENYE